MPKQNETLHPFDGIKESHKPPPVYFNVLFYGLILWAVIFIAYFLMSGWSSQGEFQAKQSAYEQQHGLTRK